MARPQSLTSMSAEALVKLRNEISAALASKARILKEQLALMGEDLNETGRSAPGRKSMLGIKIAPKYRGPGGETWAGRGMPPVWMQVAIKAGKKREDFLIAKKDGKSAPKNGRRKKR